MIQYLFEFNDWGVAASIVAFFLLSGGLLCAIAFFTPLRGYMKTAAIATPDLLIFLGVLFGLNIGFLGAEIEDRIHNAAAATSAEANAFLAIASTMNQPNTGAAAVGAAARAYLQGVLQHEFTGDRATMAYQESSRKMNDFVSAVTAFADGGSASEPVRGVVLQQAINASQARALRVSLMNAEPNELRWCALLFLLLLIQAGVVLVHGVDPRRMVAHMCVISMAGSISIAVAAVSEDPFTPPRMVSLAPLKAALAAYDASAR